MLSDRGITLFIVSLNMTGSTDLKNQLFISRGTSAYFFSRDLVFTVWVFWHVYLGDVTIYRRSSYFGSSQSELGPTEPSSAKAQTGLAHAWALAVKPPRKRGFCHGCVFTVAMRGRDDTG